ncbi:MAG: N-acetylmuramoyl-L-alanine amidase [Cyanobacteria bacterium P01_A01_bin.83]
MSFTAKVISTKDWGARPTKNNVRFRRTNPRYIVIHHTASANPPDHASKGTEAGAKQYARNIQTFHMNEPNSRPRGNGWSDSGHNFLNTTAGILLEGRHGTLDAVKQGQCVQSAHAAKQGNRLSGGNQSPGIENEGTFMTHKMEAKQWNSLVELCVALCKSCDINPANIRGHRDFSNTACPGNWLYAQLPKLRKQVADKLGVDTEDADGTSRDLQFGSEGLDVIELQTKLKEKGFDPGDIDGDFGDNTRAAVVAFQRAMGLLVDGIVGSQTRAALGL